LCSELLARDGSDADRSALHRRAAFLSGDDDLLAASLFATCASLAAGISAPQINGIEMLAARMPRRRE
jgi:hypothetical protein